MNRRKIRYLIGLAAVLALLGGAACGNDDDGSNAADDAAAALDDLSGEAQDLIDEANEGLEVSDDDVAEWCEVADQADDPTAEELETFVEKSPPEFRDHAEVLAQAIESGDFDNPEVEEAVLSLDVVIDTHCT